MIFLLFPMISAGKVQRRFPYIPVLVNHPDGYSRIENFFDLRHLKSKSTTKKLKSYINGLNSGSNTDFYFNKLEFRAQKGCGTSCFILGTIYEYGLYGHPMNDTLARNYYTIGSDNGDPNCQSSLAFFMRYGFGGQKDIPVSVILTEAASENSIWASFHSSFSHHFGHNMLKSCHKGFSELRKYADIVIAQTVYRRRWENPGVRRIARDELPSDELDQVSEYARLGAETGDPSWKYQLGMLQLRADPPDYVNGTRNLEEAAESGHIPSMVHLGMMMIEGEYFDQSLYLTKGGEWLNKAALAGSTSAMTELGKLGLQGNREIGKVLLMKALEYGNVEAYFAVGLEFLRGQPPFERNMSYGLALLNEVLKTVHFNITLTSADLMYDGLFIATCDKALRMLLLFMELSFLFDDARHGWNAMVAGDLEYALRIYQRLADMGSEAAAWNAERLSQELNRDESPWFDIQVTMNFEVALHRLANKLSEQGDSDMASKALEKAAKKEPSAAFELGWTYRWSNMTRSLKYFNRAMTISRKAHLPVRLVRAWMVIEGIPSLLLGKKDEKATYTLAYIFSWTKELVIAGLLVLLYCFIGIRLREM